MKKSSLFFVCFLIMFLLSKNVAAVFYSLTDSPYFLNEDLIIAASESIEIEAGTTFYVAPDVRIEILGQSQIVGTPTARISFLPQVPEFGWDKIEIFNGSHTITHVLIEEGLLWSEDSNSTYSFIEINNSQNLPFSVPFIRLIRGASTVHDCILNGVNKGEGILIFNQNNISVKNCIVTAVPDAIEISNINGGVIEGNHLTSMDDDAIDLNNCQNIIITDNVIDNAVDRGFEIGSQGFGSSINIIMRGNIVSNCSQGISIKEGSSVWIYHNTFYGNNNALVCAEEVANSGASFAFVENSIFSQSTNNIVVDAISSVEVYYSISDTEILDGTMNIVQEVLFMNADNLNFALSSSSPAIDSGNPVSFWDEDCTAPDMGAISYDQCDVVCPCDIEGVFVSAGPNPFQSYLNLSIRLEKEANLLVEIFNIEGSIVLSRQENQRSKGIHVITLPALNITAGAYILKVSSEHENWVEKIVKIN